MKPPGPLTAWVKLVGACYVRQGPSAFNKIRQLIHLMNGKLIHLMNGNDASGPGVIQLRLGKVLPCPSD